jgi:hypothetical protein
MKPQLKNHPFYVYLILFRGVCALGLLGIIWAKGFGEILLAGAVFLLMMMVGEAVYAGIVYAAIAEEKLQERKEAERLRQDRELKKKEDFADAQKTSTKKYIKVTSYKDAAGEKSPLKGGKLPT